MYVETYVNNVPGVQGNVWTFKAMHFDSPNNFTSPNTARDGAVWISEVLLYYIVGCISIFINT